MGSLSKAAQASHTSHTCGRRSLVAVGTLIYRRSRLQYRRDLASSGRQDEIVGAAGGETVLFQMTSESFGAYTGQCCFAMELFFSTAPHMPIGI